MIGRSRLLEIMSGYEKKKTIIEMGTHSAVETLAAVQKIKARSHDTNLETLLICEEGRHEMYAETFPEIADKMIAIKSFKDFSKRSLVAEMQDASGLLIPHRGISAYLTQRQYQNNLTIPMVGSRDILPTEDMHGKDNQMVWCQEAGINTPRMFARPEEIEGLVIIKVPDKEQPLERGFFFANGFNDYEVKSAELIDAGVITKEALAKAPIQEAVMGAYLNIVFCNNPLAQYTPFKKVGNVWIKQLQTGRIIILGFGQRIQTDIDWWVRMPARDQLKLSVKMHPQIIESGHKFCTVRESDMPKLIKAVWQYVAYCAQHSKQGFIGCGGLQGAITKKRKYVVIDTAPRTPGDIASWVSPHPEWQGYNLHGAGEATVDMILTALRLDEAISPSAQVNLARIVT